MSARTVIALVTGAALCGAAFYGFQRIQPERGAPSRLSASTSGATPEVGFKTDAEPAELPPSIDDRPGRSVSSKTPVESILFANGRIHVERANAVVSGEGFETFLEELDTNSTSQQEAREMSKPNEAYHIAATTGQKETAIQLTKKTRG